MHDDLHDTIYEILSACHGTVLLDKARWELYKRRYLYL